MTRPPNILWLMTDQQMLAGRPDVAAHLPLQRRLAQRGVRFTRAYAALPICSPARASMQTGLYPHRHGLTENDGRFGGRAGLVPGDGLLVEALAGAGYRCGWFGKWHLNNDLDAGAFGCEGLSWPGYGYPYGSAAYRAYRERQGLPRPRYRVECQGESGTPPGTEIPLDALSDWPDYESGCGVIDGPAELHEAYFLADAAAAWLRDQGDQPFFAQVNCWGPHPPYMVAPPLDRAFAGTQATSPSLHHDLADRPAHHAAYRDTWRATLPPEARDFAHLSRRALQQAALCEKALAQLLDVLEDTGLADTTFVVFCADHGDAVGSHGGMLNKGGLMVEEVLRVPVLIAGPGVQAGQTCDDLATQIDLAPTVAAAAGVSMPQADGHSLWPLLAGTGGLTRGGVMAQHYGLHVPVMQRAWLRDNWKYVLQEDGFAELYDLADDPNEMHNRAGDPTLSGLEAQLRADLRAEMLRSGDPALDRMTL